MLIGSKKSAKRVPKSGRADYASLRSSKKQDAQHLTKAQERAQRALTEARKRRKKSVAKSAAHEGVSENPLRELERHTRELKWQRKAERGTSVARVRRYGEDEDEDEELDVVDDELEMDKSAVEAELGIASPLPRSILRPRKGIVKKR